MNVVENRGNNPFVCEKGRFGDGRNKKKILLSLFFISLCTHTIYAQDFSGTWTTSFNTTNLYPPLPALYEHTAVLVNDTMVIFGGFPFSTSIIKYHTSTSFWTYALYSGTPPIPRLGHTSSIIQGRYMYVYGGNGQYGAVVFGDMSKYDLLNDAWIPLSVPSGPGIPAGCRTHHTTVVTAQGTLLIFGGLTSANNCNITLGFTLLNTIAKYDPVSNSWISVNPSGTPPPAVYCHTAVVTSSNAMLVFGGQLISSYFPNNVSKYDIGTDTWIPVTPRGTPPVGRGFHSAVFFNNFMVIYGGIISFAYIKALQTIDFYDVISNTWNGSFQSNSSSPPSIATPPQHFVHSAVVDNVTGQMIVYAGQPEWGGMAYNQVISFDLNHRNWLPLIAPSHRTKHSAVITNDNDTMLVFGGSDSQSNCWNTLLRYTISTQVWEWLSPIGTTSPSARHSHTAIVNSKNFMIIFGGFNGTTALNDVSKYCPNNDSWVSVSPSGSPPPPRYEHSAVVTSSDVMIIFGGLSGIQRLNDVAKYDTSADRWLTFVAGGTPPQQRSLHSAVISSVNKMIVFGGYTGSLRLSDLWEYDLTTDQWFPLTGGGVVQPPLTRYSHTAVAFDDVMVVFGGNTGTFALNDVAFYDILNDVWVPINTTGTLPLPRYSHSAVKTTSDTMLIFGGYDNVHYLRDVELYTFQRTTPTLTTTIISSGSSSNSQVIISTSAASSSSSSSMLVTTGNVFSSSSSISTSSTASNQPHSSSSSKSASSVIYTVIGVVIGVVVLLLVVGIGVFIFLRRKFRRLMSPELQLELQNLQDIKIVERLGDGKYGEVYRGIWLGTTAVALKSLKSVEDTSEIIQEALVLRECQHPNIVQYLGIYVEEGVTYVVTEFMSGGSLLSLLRKEKEKLTLTDLLEMAKQAGSGMVYLERKGIVHRDLALRNLLVTTQGTDYKYLVKVADFGLSRVAEGGIYTFMGTTIPVKWSAPEVIEYGQSSHNSDVWSFGVLLWELFSRGKEPYPGLSNKETIEKVTSGHRMEAPDECPTEIYKLMLRCWGKDPDSRPHFKEICDNIDSVWKEYKKSSQSSSTNKGPVQRSESINRIYNNN